METDGRSSKSQHGGMSVGGLFCSPSYFSNLLYCTVQYCSNVQYSAVQYCTVPAGELESNLLLSSAHSLKERFELHESFLILRFTQFLHQCLSFLLGELLSKVGEETEQFIANHGIVSILVVQLQDLHEVVEATLVLGVLGLSTTDLIDGLQGWVEVTGTDEVPGIESIHLTVSLEVVHVESEFNRVNFLLLKSELSHCYCSVTTESYTDGVSPRSHTTVTMAE